MRRVPRGSARAGRRRGPREGARVDGASGTEAEEVVKGDEDPGGASAQALPPDCLREKVLAAARKIFGQT